MCGILGYLNYKDGIVEERAANALKTISHRGPDNRSHWFDGSNIFLGHNRLSIIDLSESANQPLVSSHCNARIIFNGEIYNYKELRDTLKFRNFKTQSDTETVLEGYLEQGTSFFKNLRGIYAFCIVDQRQETKTILVRDPSGIKPLYYHSNPSAGRLIFASEIKAIKPLCKANLTINQTAVHQYLNLGYVPEPHTAYNEIVALSPGHLLQWTPFKDSREERFFKFDFNYTNSDSFQSNLNRVNEKLLKAAERNTVADVKVSVALSGGIDSSLLYHYLMKSDSNLLALSVSFDQDSEFDESSIAKLYSKTHKGNHELISLNEHITLDTVHTVFDHFDQPYADSSAIPSFFLNKAARRYGKVIIGGDGGDELFNGYPSQTWLSLLYKYRKFAFVTRTITGLGKLIPGKISRQANRINGLFQNGDEKFGLLYNRNSWFPSTTRHNNKVVFKYPVANAVNGYSHIFSDEIPDEFDQTIVFDYFRKTMLSDYLRKTDLMSMYHGVEWRVPMLDEDLVMCALSIPFHQKSELKKTKIILRRLHEQAYGGLANTAPKRGFTIPLDKYLTPENKQTISLTLLDKNSAVREMVDEKYIQFLSDEFHNYKSAELISRESVFQRILILYNLQRWFNNQ